MTARASDIPRREVLGVPLAITDYGGAIAAMDGMIERREPGYVCALAVHAVMVSRRDPELLAALRAATLCVPDGRPLVWALNALGAELQDRVYGPELMARYCSRAADVGHRVLLYGGATPAAMETLQQTLRSRYPGIEIAGGQWQPHRPMSPDEEHEAVERINAARADVIFVGLGAPRQEKWMAHMRPRLEAPVLIGVGAAFDFIAGLKPQAPGWMQRRGLEWLFRLSQEPLRLGPRYAKYNPAFLAAFARQFLRERGGGR